MKKLTIYGFFLIPCLLTGIAMAQEYQVIRRYYDDGMLKNFGTNIIIKSTPVQAIKFTRWLDQIALVPKGFQTLLAISNTPHELIILSADYARESAGRTRAPMTMNLINGIGDDAEIVFDGRTQENGSHMVYNAKMEMIEYTAIQNLYHELAHAMHMMNGTWRYFDSEGQAIEEENIFRRQLAKIQGRPLTQRFLKDGVLIRDIGPTHRFNESIEQ